MRLNAPIITPDNVDVLCGPEGERVIIRGGHVRILNFRPPADPYGYCRSAQADAMTLIPREQWPDLIALKDRQKSWLIDSVEDVRVKDQDGLGYCHAYGTVSCMEVALVYAGYPYQELSAESVGGPVTGWINEGADPSDDLQQAISGGACLQSFMDKPNSIDQARWKSGWETDAKSRRVLEAWDLRLPGKAFDAVVSAAILNMPVGLGYVWWGHFVHGGFQVRQQGGKYQILNRNSWGASYGDDGYFWLDEGTARGQGTPDWAFAVRVVIPQED